MFALIFLLFSEAGHTTNGGWSQFWNQYLNYPGFEAWKFINLAIFVGLMVYLLKKPLSETFKARREQIRAELINAEAEKQAALAKLTEAEAKLARLDLDREMVLTDAREEALGERTRLADQTEIEIKKLRDQANSEIVRTATLAKRRLRKHSAEETIRLAEEMIKERLGAKEDAKLIKAGIESLGGAK